MTDSLEPKGTFLFYTDEEFELDEENPAWLDDHRKRYILTWVGSFFNVMIRGFEKTPVLYCSQGERSIKMTPKWVKMGEVSHLFCVCPEFKKYVDGREFDSPASS